MKRLLIVIILLVLVTSACTPSTRNESSTGELPNPSQWKLVTFGKSGSETPVIQDSNITLHFEEKYKMGGNGGCNSYGGTYETRGDTLGFKEVISTLMACTDEQVMQQEYLYLQALQNVTRFEITATNLTLFYDGGQSRLNFIKEGSG